MSLFESLLIERELGLLKGWFHSDEVGLDTVLDSSMAFIVADVTPGALDVGQDSRVDRLAVRLS